MEKLCVTFLQVLLAILIARSAQGTSCPSCVHMSYSVSGLPPMIQSMMDSMLSQTGLENSACLEGTSDVAEICQAHSLPGFVVNKCQTTEVTVNAKGLAYFADAQMEVTVWVKNCIQVMKGEPDKCTRLSEMDEETQAQFTAQLEAIRASWNSATYSGQVCTHTP